MRRMSLLSVVLVALLTWSGAKMTAEPSSSPPLDWLFDGGVWATARVGNTLFVGGAFQNAFPASQALGYFFGLSASTGAVAPGQPFVDGAVSAIEPDGTGGFFIAGSFRAVGPRGTAPNTTGLAHVRADGTLDPAFAPPAGVGGGLVRVGPSLITEASFGRQLVALDAVTGVQFPWVPVLPTSSPIAPASILDFEAAGGVLYVLSSDGSGNRQVTAFDGVSGVRLWVSPVIGRAGGFDEITGELVVVGARLIVGILRLYALDTATGAVDPSWGSQTAVDAPIRALVVSGGAAYLSGSFTTLNAQARTGAAAVDLALGTVLPWQPAVPLTLLAASPTGTLIGSVAGAFPSWLLVEVDASGALTGWTPTVSVGVTLSPPVVDFSPSGTLVVGTSGSSHGGRVARRALAAFDLATGAVLPDDIALTGAPPSSFQGRVVTSLAALGQTLYVGGQFLEVNGHPRQGAAAIDVSTTTVLPWSLPPHLSQTGGAIGTPVLARGDWTYVDEQNLVSGSDVNLKSIRRYHRLTGVKDAAWAPPPFFDFIEAGGQLVASRQVDRIQNLGTAMGDVDETTGQLREWFRTLDVPFGARLAVSGDTVYLAGAGPDRTLPTTQPENSDFVIGVDRRTGVRVGPNLRGNIGGLAVADGRLIAFGGARIILNGVERVGLAEIARPGTFTAWDPRVPLFGPRFVNGNYLTFRSGIQGVLVAGDYLVARGNAILDFSPYRVTAYPLSGSSVPSNLRSQTSGPNTVFTWDGMATPPAGGYVIEGGFAAGQIAGALAVGTATNVVLPMPAGPVFIRVRPQGGTEVSNEIAAGCFAPPLPPTALTTSLTGTNLSLAWTSPAGAVTAYSFSAGTSAGSSNAATVTLPGTQTSIGGSVPGGTFFARVTATNACGTSGPSGEVFFTIGAPDPLPAAPTNLASSLSGNSVSLSWTAPAGAVTGYVLEAGTGAGLANLGTLRLGATPSLVVPGVPAGSYVLRVRAITSAGSGAASTDVVVVVP